MYKSWICSLQQGMSKAEISSTARRGQSNVSVMNVGAGLPAAILLNLHLLNLTAGVSGAAGAAFPWLASLFITQINLSPIWH